METCTYRYKDGSICGLQEDGVVVHTLVCMYQGCKAEHHQFQRIDVKPIKNERAAEVSVPVDDLTLLVEYAMVTLGDSPVLRAAERTKVLLASNNS